MAYTYCPICFNPKARVRNREEWKPPEGYVYQDVFSGDPIFTPNHFDARLKGITPIRGRHIRELQDFITELEYSILPLTPEFLAVWLYNPIWGFNYPYWRNLRIQVPEVCPLMEPLSLWLSIEDGSTEIRNDQIDQLRFAIERILTELAKYRIGMTPAQMLAEYLSMNRDGKVIGEPQATEWLDAERDGEGTPRLIQGRAIRGLHIEQLRKDLPHIERETWTPIAPSGIIDHKVYGNYYSGRWLFFWYGTISRKPSVSPLDTDANSFRQIVDIWWDSHEPYMPYGYKVGECDQWLGYFGYPDVPRDYGEGKITHPMSSGTISGGSLILHGQADSVIMRYGPFDDPPYYVYWGIVDAEGCLIKGFFAKRKPKITSNKIFSFDVSFSYAPSIVDPAYHESGEAYPDVTFTIILNDVRYNIRRPFVDFEKTSYWTNHFVASYYQIHFSHDITSPYKVYSPDGQPPHIDDYRPLSSLGSGQVTADLWTDLSLRSMPFENNYYTEQGFDGLVPSLIYLQGMQVEITFYQAYGGGEHSPPSIQEGNYNLIISNAGLIERPSP